METNKRQYLDYISIENNNGDNLRLIPFAKFDESKHYEEQNYSELIIDGNEAGALAKIKAQFKIDRKEWVKNAFGYLD
jgi:hypothetical protein